MPDQCRLEFSTPESICGFWTTGSKLTALTLMILCAFGFCGPKKVSAQEDRTTFLAGPSQHAVPQPSFQTIATSPAPVADTLDARMQFWRARAATCDLNELILNNSRSGFPTKHDHAVGTPKDTCDDGDMALFNGLLCAAGEEKGCGAVRDSLNFDTGHWWRSPAIKVRREKDGSNDSVDQPNLNSDQALGVMLYLLQKSDGKAFRHWMQFVARNGPCTSDACNGLRAARLPISVPRYCALKGSDSGNCMFRPVDCPLILLTGAFLGEQRAALSVCGPLNWIGLPDPATFQPKIKDALSAYRDAYNAVSDVQDKIVNLHKKLGFAPPPFPPLPVSPDQIEKTFGPIITKMDNVRDEAEALVKIPDFGGFAVAYAGAVPIVEANALANGKQLKDGKLVVDPSGSAASARHLAGTAIFILEKFGIKTPGLKEAAGELLKEEPKNPYFEFLSHGGPTDDMKNWITEQCPPLNFDPGGKVLRFEWSWERQDSKIAASQSMYWDCIFAGDLYQHGVQPITISRGIQNYLPRLQDVLQVARDTKDLFEAQLALVAKQVLDLKSSKDLLDHQLQSLGSVAAAVAKGALPQYDPKTGAITLPAPPGTPVVTVNPSKGNVTVPVFGCLGFHC